MPPRPNPWKGFVLGLIGGAVGVMAMDYYQQKLGPALFSSDDEGDSQGQQNQPPGRQPLASLTLIGQQHRQDESSTAALGRIMYTRMAGEEPNQETKSTLSYGVHWGYGILQGGVYGLMRARTQFSSIWSGPGFGLGLWLFGDELAVPLLGLQDGPTAYASQTHLNRAAMHLVYGTVTGLTTQLLQRFL